MRMSRICTRNARDLRATRRFAATRAARATRIALSVGGLRPRWGLVLCAIACAASACATSGSKSDASGAGSGSGSERERAAAAADPTYIEPENHGPGAVDYVMVVPENVVWLPWKLIGTAGKGAVDGASAGFGRPGMPILGVIFAPVNIVAGFVTGLAEGAVMSPGVVGPSDKFGKAMAAPTKHDTSIWWYD